MCAVTLTSRVFRSRVRRCDFPLVVAPATVGSFTAVYAGGAALILSFHPDGMRGGHHFAADFSFPLAAAWDFDGSGFSACKSLSGNGGITVGLISSTPDDAQLLFP